MIQISYPQPRIVSACAFYKQGSFGGCLEPYAETQRPINNFDNNCFILDTRGIGQNRFEGAKQMEATEIAELWEWVEYY
jgi:hypothetical protein